jgi:hypothetical protein
MSNAKEEIAALRREVAELKSKVDPPKSTFVPMTDEEWFDRQHQIKEGRMALATPPSAIEALVAGEPKGFMREVAMRDARAPSSPRMIPTSQSAGGGGSGEGERGTGWVAPTPLGPQPGIFHVDAQLIADEVRKRKLGE